MSVLAQFEQTACEGVAEVTHTYRASYMVWLLLLLISLFANVIWGWILFADTVAVNKSLVGCADLRAHVGEALHRGA